MMNTWDGMGQYHDIKYLGYYKLVHDGEKVEVIHLYDPDYMEDEGDKEYCCQQAEKAERMQLCPDEFGTRVSAIKWLRKRVRAKELHLDADLVSDIKKFLDDPKNMVEVYRNALIDDPLDNSRTNK